MIIEVLYNMGLEGWIPASNLLHDEKFSFFDFELRVILKILSFFLGFAQQFWQHTKVLPIASKR